MFSNLRKQLVPILSLFTVAGVVAVAAAPADAGSEYRVRARIRTGTALEAKGDYRERLIGTSLLQRWSVEVGGAQPGQSFEVQLNGNPVGVIIANSLGRAEQEFHTTVVDDNPHDENPPLPTDFPHINAGDTLTVVGIGSASFARR